MVCASIKHRSSETRSITAAASLKRLSWNAAEDIRQSENYSTEGMTVVVVAVIVIVAAVVLMVVMMVFKVVDMLIASVVFVV